MCFIGAELWIRDYSVCVCVCYSDGDELKKSLSELVDKNDHTHTKSISRISSGSNPFLDIAHDPNAAVYKTGFLARKIHADMDGKKSKIIKLNQSMKRWSVCVLVSPEWLTLNYIQSTLLKNKYY